MVTFTSSDHADRIEPNLSVNSLGHLDVSIIIVTWNSANFIGECLTSVYEETHGCSFEVMVVDNGSKDRTVQIVSEQFPQVRLIPTGANLGFPRANNLAIRKAAGNFLFLVNPDSSLRNDVASELARFLGAHPDAGAASPLILKEGGGMDFFAARDFPSISGTLFILSGLRKLFSSSLWNRNRSTRNGVSESTRTAPCLTGAALMMPKSLMLQLGLLDVTLPLYFEDLDICAKIRAAGKNLYSVPSAELTHIGAKSAEESPVRPILWAMEKGQAPWMWFRTYRGYPAAFAFSLATFAGSAFRCCILGVAMPFASWGGKDVVTWFKGTMTKSWALLKWSISSKRKFGKQVCAMFAHESPIEVRDKSLSSVDQTRIFVDKPESIKSIE